MRYYPLLETHTKAEWDRVIDRIYGLGGNLDGYGGPNGIHVAESRWITPENRPIHAPHIGVYVNMSNAGLPYACRYNWGDRNTSSALRPVNSLNHLIAYLVKHGGLVTPPPF